MNRNTVNFVMVLTAFGVLLVLGFTGFITRYVLPPGSSGRRQHGCPFSGGGGGMEMAESSEEIMRFWSLGRHEWGGVHFYLAMVFVVLMIVHIILHWTWVKGYVKLLFSSSQLSE